MGGGGEGHEDIEGGSENFYTPEGGLWKNCWARRGALKFLLPKWGRGGRAPKKLNRCRWAGVAK